MRPGNQGGQQAPTATIYQFPIGGRAGLKPRPGALQAQDFRQPAYPAVDFGSGWYHDDAIEEAKRKVEH